MKQCFKCHEVRPLSEFYKHPQMADGHLNKCKICTRKDTVNNRRAKQDRYIAYDRERSALPHRRANASRVTKRWRQMYPKRRKAQTALGYAIRTGEITPWPVCAIPECSKKPEAHHPDYDQPLDVVWLCSAHHKAAHHSIR